MMVKIAIARVLLSCQILPTDETPVSISSPLDAYSTVVESGADLKH